MINIAVWEAKQNWKTGVCFHFISVPYRDSVLTKLLKNALGGNSKTIMVSLLTLETGTLAVVLPFICWIYLRKHKDILSNF